MTNKSYDDIDKTQYIAEPRKKINSGNNKNGLKKISKVNQSNDDFLTRSLQIIDKLDGFYKATIKSINHCANEKVAISFDVECYNALYIHLQFCIDVLHFTD